MAQPIHCDGPDHRDVLADVMVSQIAVAEVVAFCADHFLEYCRAFIAAAEAAMAEAEAEAASSAAHAETVLEGVSPPEGADVGGDDPERLPGGPGPDDDPDDPEGDEPDATGLGSSEASPEAEATAAPA